MSIKIFRSAIISDCGKFRHVLIRQWDKSKGMIAFIGLNPSTADGIQDDRTITKLIGYTQAWGYGGFYMLNVFDYRATKSRELRIQKRLNKPIVSGDWENYLEGNLGKVSKVICMWGNNAIKTDPNQVKRVKKILKNSKVPRYCFGVTQHMQPIHPLYLAADIKPIEFGF